jgi:hypothetical protein
MEDDETEAQRRNEATIGLKEEEVVMMQER